VIDSSLLHPRLAVAIYHAGPPTLPDRQSRSVPASNACRALVREPWIVSDVVVRKSATPKRRANQVVFRLQQSRWQTPIADLYLMASFVARMKMSRLLQECNSSRRSDVPLMGNTKYRTRQGETRDGYGICGARVPKRGSNAAVIVARVVVVVVVVVTLFPR